MDNPCDFCIEETCGGGSHKSCNCNTCPKANECPRILRPTIRVTTKCTQSCSHCCFSCSPKRDEHMSPDMAWKVYTFLTSNNIWSANIMGGEISCNPDWKEVMRILLSDLRYVRIVTNGDWVGTDFLEYLLPYKGIIHLAISRDRWHTNSKVDEAAAEAEKLGFFYKVTKPEEATAESIVPTGRGELVGFFYSSMGCYCHNPRNKYSFLIDETGAIYKCGFGVWDYDSIENFQEGGFAPRFKEFNQKFYKCFISSCAACIRVFEQRKH